MTGTMLQMQKMLSNVNKHDKAADQILNHFKFIEAKKTLTEISLY